MNVKYYANNMQEAIAKIKKELGAEAIILSSKQVRSKKGIFGFMSPKVYEVIAEYDPSMAKEKNRPKSKLSGNGSSKSSSSSQTTKPAFDLKTDRIDRAIKQVELAEKKNEKKTIEKLDNKMDELSEIIQNFSTKFEYLKKDVTYDYEPKVENILISLMEKDVDEEYAHEICAKVTDLIEKKKVSHIEALDHILREIIGDVSEIESNKFDRKVVMIVGPTGVGKTTTLVKLASYFVVKQELKVGIINTDVYRVAAQEQLKTYSKILNVPMATVYKPSDMKAALKEFEDMDLVFVDTAGKVSGDKEYQEDVKAYIEEGNIDEIYLALCGSSSTKILKETIDNYAFLKKHSIIVTKLDEGIKNGVLINIKLASNRPLSYVTVGQSVPDDIQKVDVCAIVSEMVRY